VAVGCVLNNDLTFAAGGKADIRASVSNGNLGGAGTVNRSVWLGSAQTKSGMPQLVVPLIPPFPDNAYNVSLQLVEGPGNPVTKVTAKLGDSFTVNDAVGENTFDVILIHWG
jgi:hypothetical protein